MGVKFLQDLVESNNVFPDSTEAVDLIQLGINLTKNTPAQSRKSGNAPKLGLVVDGECCLNRLYGGYFSGKFSRANLFKILVFHVHMRCPRR